MKIFKNKFFIITLSIAVFLVILTSTLALMGQTDPIKNVFNTATMGFRYVGIKISEAAEGFSKYFQSIDELEQRNKELESEIERLESELVDAQAAKDENARLREYIDVKKAYPDFKFADALIVGTQSENHTTFFTLDRGSSDGIKVGMPVIVTSGVVGSVCEVGYNWCRVRALTESLSSAGAYVSRSGETGVLSGDISFKGTGKCMLEYLSENADVEIGDLVYTSGQGSVYPPELYIGKISSVEIDGYLRTKVAVVDCAVDFESLKYVMIITDFEAQSVSD